MNIVKFFRGGKVEQATETNDVLDELAGEEKRKREIQAEQIARERRETEEYRARNAATLADFLKRKGANTTEINRHVVALLLALTDTKKLLAESNYIPFDGTVRTTEDVFGFPYNFPDTLIAAISSAAPETQWDWSSTGQPKLKGPQEIRVPRFPGDNAAPPGFVGAWDMLRGQPYEEPLLVLPINPAD